MKTLALRPRDLDVLLGILRRFPSVRRAAVFGSRASARARRTSDLDLAISAPDATAAEWSDLMGALEEAPLIYELDLVRLENTDNARLIGKIAREGVQIYPSVSQPEIRHA